MGFFSWRRKRESAIPESSAETAALGSFANPDGRPVVGQQVGGGQPSGDLQGLGLTDGLQMLTQLGPMIQQAMATGNVQISQGEARTIDMRGTALGDQIKEIMQQHGIDPEQGAVNAGGDANSYMQMQQQILQALARHGIDPNASGTSINVTNVEIEGHDDSPGRP